MKLLKFVKTFEQKEREQSEQGRKVLARQLLSGKFDGAVLAVRRSDNGAWESFICNTNPQEVLFATRLINYGHVDKKCFKQITDPWLRDDDLE